MTVISKLIIKSINQVIMKSFLIVLAGLSFSIVSCNKEETPKTYSSINYIHAAPGESSFQIFTDTVGPVNTPGVAYAAATGYIGIIPGSRNICLENRSVTPVKVFANFTGENIKAGKAYSYFLYDTATVKGLKTLRLEDDLTLPAPGMTRVRFLNLAPNAQPMDVTLVRGTQLDTSSTSTQKLAFVAIDSVTIPNQTYVGNTTPDIAALSAFKAITGVTGNPIGKAPNISGLTDFFRNNRYTIKLKTAGTQTVLAQTVTTLMAGRIYTIFARGTAKGQALGITIAQNY